MGGSYRQCTECGKRALSIATRCPGCGRELPVPEVPEHGGIREFGGIRTPQGLAVALAIVAVIASAQLGRTTQRDSQPEEEESSFVAAVPAAPADFSGVTAAGTTTAPAASASAGAMTGGIRPEFRVARTWTHVRKSRSRSADLEAVLLPGDTVIADSLGRGWYRVALEGEVLGYAHQSTLAEAGGVASH
jgi:hypothetical protein